MKIRFCSPIRASTGYAEFGRILIDQCVRAGHEVGVAEMEMGVDNGDYGALGKQALALRGRVKAGAAEVNIVNMIPRLFERNRVPGARNIGVTMFETDRLPADWVEQCNGMDAIWVPAEWVREVFVASGVSVPVSVVGVDAVAAPYVPPPEPAPFRLLSIFEWSGRKNPVGLLRAYCAAFDGDEGVALTLKVTRHGDPKALEFLNAELRRAIAGIQPQRGIPRIDVSPNVLSNAQMRLLHERCHAYVSLAHGEGWGLPPWESTLAGRPVIHTAWSAPMEFLHPQGQVACHLEPVYGMNDFAPFWNQGMRWAEPHLDDAIDKLRSLHKDYAAWTANALAHRDAMLERYSLAARVAQVQAALAA